MTTVSTISTLPTMSTKVELVFSSLNSGKGGIVFFNSGKVVVALLHFRREKKLERLCNIVNCTPCTKYLTIGVRTLNVKEYWFAFCWEQMLFFLKSRRSKFLLMNGYFSLVQINISCLNKLIFPICINMNIFWPNISHGPHIWIFLPFAWMYFPP